MVGRLWAGHLSFVEAGAWLPILTGLAVGVRRRYGVAFLALAVALLALAGQPELLIFSLWWLPVWAGLGALAAGRRATIVAVARTALAVGLGIGIAAFQLVPVAEMLAITNRQVGMSWDFRTGASLPPWHVLALAAPLLFGEPRASYWPDEAWMWHERLLYVGVVTLLAAAWARGWWAWFCWAAAVVAVALALGRYAPWYAWADVLPGYQFLRIPSRHGVLAALALALAAGLGLPRLAGGRVALAALLGAALLGLGSVSVADWLPVVQELIGTQQRNREALASGQQIEAHLRSLAILLVALSCVALLPRPWAVRGALLLAVVELVTILHPYRMQLASPENILAEGEVLRGQPRGVIVGDVFVANYGPLLRTVQPGGFLPLFSAGYMELLSGSRNPGVVLSAARDNDAILRLLGYGFVFDRRANQVTVLEPPPPLVWVARCVRPGGAREVREPAFPRGQCITRDQAPAADPVVSPGPARIVAERAGWLEAEAEGPGWLVTVLPWYPGWSATVDGVAAIVEAVDGALVAVQLPEGDHRVVLSYRPAGLERGLAISAGALLLVLATLWWDRRRVRAPELALAGAGASLSDGASRAEPGLRRTLEREVVEEGDGDGQQERPEDGAGQATLAQELGEGNRDAGNRGQEVEQVADALGDDRGGIEGEVRADDPRHRPQG
jgi:hypothetical protein